MTRIPTSNDHRPSPGAPAPSFAYDARLTELARAAGARRHGEALPQPGPALPLPDAALVIGLALQSVKQIGRVPLPLRNALERLAANGEPTSRAVLAWLGHRKPTRTSGRRTAR